MLIFELNLNFVSLKFKCVFIFFFIFSIPLYILGQETVFEEKTTIYDKEISGGIGMHTNGFLALFRFGKYLDGFTKRIYEIELANIRHPKEIKSVNPFEQNARGYIFGKMNSFFALRPSIGLHKEFIPKQSLYGVSITYVAHIGPSIGITKPVYLNVLENEPFSNRANIVKRKYDPEEHQQGDIYGRASFLNGFDELQIHPGIFAKFGFHFDFASSRESLRAVEAGIKIDAFFEEIPIMAFTDNRAIYTNLYVSILFGSREVR